MFDYQYTNLVISKAGHDKGEYFVILRSDSEYVYLVDGISRTLEKPKKKKIKHVQCVNYQDEQLVNKSSNNELVTNEEIKRALKLYKINIR